MTSLSSHSNKLWAVGAALACLFALSLAACHHVEPEQRAVQPKHGLSGFADCDAFTKYAKKAAEDKMMTAIEQVKDSMSGWGDEVWEGDMAGGDGDADSDSDADAPTGNDDHSQTNTQEQGVDEPDLIKNDGDYLYVLHQGELVITAASDQGDLEHAGRAEVGGYAEEMFLRDDLAVVFSSLTANDVPSDMILPEGTDTWWDCDGWDCSPFVEYTQIAVIDVTDRTAPEVLRTIILGGVYNTARLIDDKLKLVIYSDIPILHMSWDDDGIWNNDWNDFVDTAVYLADVVQENLDAFGSATVDDILPRKLDSQDGVVTPAVECTDIYGPETPAGIGLTTVVSLDLDVPDGPLSTSSVFGQQGLVYATPESLYLTTSRDYVFDAWSWGLWSEETSGVHKLDISRDDSAALPVATGEVPGRMLNQFCLGEHEGFLRVATTTGSPWGDSELDNHVIVLEPQGTELATVGELHGLGQGEEIYAARFMGDRGFLVTFFEQDPLYTLDLADPTAPTAVGEWHGPGYSTYLHPVEDDRVLAVGIEDWEVTVSLYDVSDFADPTLVERLYFPDGSEYSAAVDDHKAFTFKAETGMLALPYTGWDGNTGVYIYDVDETGIDHTGTLAVADIEESVGHVVRSAYIGDAIFGISRCRVASAALADPSVIIDTVELYTSSTCDDYGWNGGWDEGWWDW
jgi:hypothetical protein